MQVPVMPRATLKGDFTIHDVTSTCTPVQIAQTYCTWSYEYRHTMTYMCVYMYILYTSSIYVYMYMYVTVCAFKHLEEQGTEVVTPIKKAISSVQIIRTSHVI